MVFHTNVTHHFTTTLSITPRVYISESDFQDRIHFSQVVNYNKLEIWLSTESWLDVLHINDPQIAYNCFINKLQDNVSQIHC